MLSGAWTQLTGELPSERTLHLLTSHWAVETDAGRAMPGHNFAGIKASPRASGAVFATVEGFGPNRREVQARFRVYDSAAAGAHDYVRLLATRYPKALEAARLGDAKGFAGALAKGGYFTADPIAYGRALESRLSELAGSASTARVELNGQWSSIALAGVLRALRPPRQDT